MLCALAFSFAWNYTTRGTCPSKSHTLLFFGSVGGYPEILLGIAPTFNIAATSRPPHEINIVRGKLPALAFQRVTCGGRICAPTDTIIADVRVAPVCCIHPVTATATNAYWHRG